ncbi:ATP synthase subunit I [Prochlorococcus marinus]|uniref:ATP synthase subunit I n=1 Tax=Prochlorococcus marinus TaxID=1219 RepID=UPI0022B448A4|nr:ATP synthase subunit I [Prochlorococcus marinus]
MVDSAGLWSKELLLASRLVLPFKNSSNEEDSVTCSDVEASNLLKPSIDLGSLDAMSKDSSQEYVTFQRHIYRMTLVLTLFFGLLTAIFLDLSAAISLLLGALCGILYLRLLAKSIGSLGRTSNSIGKVQLLVPVLLVLVITKLPFLELLPSLAGFLLYKPSFIIHFLFKRSA